MMFEPGGLNPAILERDCCSSGYSIAVDFSTKGNILAPLPDAGASSALAAYILSETPGSEACKQCRQFTQADSKDYYRQTDCKLRNYRAVLCSLRQSTN